MNRRKAIKENYYPFSKEINGRLKLKKYDEKEMNNYCQSADNNLKVIYKKYLLNKDHKLGRHFLPNTKFLLNITLSNYDYI